MWKKIIKNWKLQVVLVGVLVLLVVVLFLIKSNTSPTSSVDSPKKIISSIVIPHHDLVKPIRQQFLKKLAQNMSEPKTIILVSPNHFDYGAGAVQTTMQSWQLAQGTYQPNVEVISPLLISRSVSLEPASFQDELGIKLLIEDLHNVFPDAKLVPLIIKTGTPNAVVDTLNQKLNENCPNCLMVASVDFSHYQPVVLANEHDALTIRGLLNLDAKFLHNKAEVDSPATLSLLALWAENHETRRFTIFQHTNSGLLYKNPDLESTSHVFGWYEKGQQEVPEVSVNFLFGGDAMFGRGVEEKFQKVGMDKIFAQFGDRVFWGTDASVINLEGVISDKPIDNSYLPNNLVFRFPKSILTTLKSFLRLNVVSQGNNHSENAGDDGFMLSKKILEDMGISVVGGPRKDDNKNIVIIKGQEKNLYLISVNALAPFTDIRDLIKKSREDQKNAVIVLPHWGTEYATRHNETQEKMAHAWIDAGADAIIGSHSHVIQDLEVYQGRPIVYSLGNLVFDQTFSLATQQGLLVGGHVDDKGLTLFFLPIESKNLMPSLLVGAVKKQIIDSLYQSSEKYLKNTEGGEVLFFPH